MSNAEKATELKPQEGTSQEAELNTDELEQIAGADLYMQNPRGSNGR